MRRRGKLSNRSSSLIQPEILSSQTGPALSSLSWVASPFTPALTGRWLKSSFQPKGYAAFLIYTLLNRTSIGHVLGLKDTSAATPALPVTGAVEHRITIMSDD